MILSKGEKKNGIPTITVDKDYTDEEVAKKEGLFHNPKDRLFVIRENADVYTKSGELLLRFRKGVLPLKNAETAYENLISFAKTRTRTRGVASGSAAGTRCPGNNTSVMSNLMGYFDKWTLLQKHRFKSLGIKPPFAVRVSRFLTSHPERWHKVIPFIQDIDRMYKKLTPTYYNKQRALANETAYRIPNTAFTTITTNVNNQTAFHTDAGDCPEGFGNLVVIGKGKYKGGYTIFPQYGVGVDVRTGDFLAMNVHKLHGNTKLTPLTKDAVRMSIVCYLRQNVWARTRGSTHKDVEKNIATMKSINEKYTQWKKKKK